MQASSSIPVSINSCFCQSVLEQDTSPSSSGASQGQSFFSSEAMQLLTGLHPQGLSFQDKRYQITCAAAAATSSAPRPVMLPRRDGESQIITHMWADAGGVICTLTLHLLDFLLYLTQSSVLLSSIATFENARRFIYFFWWKMNPGQEWNIDNLYWSRFSLPAIFFSECWWNYGKSSVVSVTEIWLRMNTICCIYDKKIWFSYNAASNKEICRCYRTRCNNFFTGVLMCWGVACRL